MKLKNLSMVATVAAVMTLSACSTVDDKGTGAMDQDTAARVEALKQKEAALRTREQELASRESTVAAREGSVPAPAGTMAMAAGDGLLPPNARPGECYARIWIAPTYKTITEKVVTKPESERLEIIPATYGKVKEKMLVKEASSKLVPVAATYGTTTEKVMVRNSETYWTYSTHGVANAKKSGRDSFTADASLLRAVQTYGVPQSASVGQCFAEYNSPAKYRNVTEKMLKSEASTSVKVIPAKYQWVEEKVLVSEGYDKLAQIPATYGTETEKVLISPERTEWTVSECSGGACAPGQLMPNQVKGISNRIDQSTGEIMCLVTVPAKYKTITRKVMKTPPTTKRTSVPAKYAIQKVRKLVEPAKQQVVSIPESFQTITKREKVSDPVTTWCQVGASGSAVSGCAGMTSASRTTGNALCLKESSAKYKTVTRRVVKTPATTREIAIPAEYKTVTKRVQTRAAQEKRIVIPAKFGTVSRKEQTSEGHMQWRPVLCQANMTRAKVMEIQRALQKAGHYRGPIDGIVGTMTTRAVNSYQKSKGLIGSNFLTIETVKSLGINPI